MSKRAKQLGKFEKVGECLYRYTSNGGYYAVVRHEGKLIRRSLETTDRALAKRKLGDFKDDLQRIDSSLGKMTVGQLLVKFEATLKTLDINTIKKLEFVSQHFRKHWAPGMAQSVRKAKPSEIETWLGLMREEYAISYYNEHVQFVRRMKQGQSQPSVAHCWVLREELLFQRALVSWVLDFEWEVGTRQGIRV